MRSIAVFTEEWPGHWWRQDAARRRVEGLLNVLAAAESAAIVELGRQTQTVDSAGLEVIRRRAREAFYALAHLPIIGEEMAIYEIDNQIRTVAEDLGVPRAHAHGIAPASERDVFDWALAGALDALLALLVADGLSARDFKSLTRPWRKAVGGFAPDVWQSPPVRLGR